MAPRENINSASNADPIDRIGTNANERTPTRKYTVTEVEKHSTPDDCWLIVRGKVYDVTPFVPRHPGGNMIWVEAGGDCTQLLTHIIPYELGHCWKSTTLESCSAGQMIRTK